MSSHYHRGIPLWRDASPVELGESSPKAQTTSYNQSPDLESPIELPAEAVLAITENQPPITHTRSASSNYYEDVDPKFAADEPVITPMRPPVNTSIAALQAGAGPGRYAGSSYDDLPKDVDRMQGNRSPAVSETSNFTSISQRPINPSWRPPPAPPMAGLPYAPRGRGRGAIRGGARGGRGAYAESSIYSGPASQASSRYRAQETVLNANPDFAIPSPSHRRMVGSPPRTARPAHGRVLSNGSHHYPD